jgi:hypothetical protein
MAAPFFAAWLATLFLGIYIWPGTQQIYIKPLFIYGNLSLAGQVLARAWKDLKTS